MPDWSYHTLFKPILFRMPARAARRVTLQTVALLGASPGGGAVIDFMGHMRPDRSLECEALGRTFASRVGLGAGLTTSGGAIAAFERFGFGYIELGPLTVQPVPDDIVLRNLNELSLTYANAPVNEGLEEFVKGLPSQKPNVCLMVRIANVEGTSCTDAIDHLQTIVARLPQWIDVIVLDSRWCLLDWSNDDLDRYLKAAADLGKTILVSVAPDLGEEKLSGLIESAKRKAAFGFSVSGGTTCGDKQESRLCGAPTRTQSMAMVRRLRELVPDAFIIGSGGIIEPIDAVEMLDAGATMVQLHSGMVYSGPGLPKRINELISARTQLCAACKQPAPSSSSNSPYSFSAVSNSGWLGLALVGAGLLITCSSAITVALTTVILPYDEHYLGITRLGMIALNDRLLPFMSHDRITYAGSGASCGLLFLGLAFFGARKGNHWAYLAARTSCAFGFISFLLFLGFHYLDPLHTLATLLLLPFYFWAVIKPPPVKPMLSSNLRNSNAWFKGLAGQFWFVGIGCGLILAGIAISSIGITSVFVPDDLRFMHTTAHDLLCHNDRLLPAIAHDRAGFGGSLFTVGVGVLMTALHGFRQGEGWVWWMLLISGLPGFICTLAIHFAIGYTSWFHLLPAYIGFVMFVGGLWLSYPYLCVEPAPE
jgi:dihydroorotate dehydrogenase